LPTLDANNLPAEKENLMSIVRSIFLVGRRYRCALTCDPSAIVPGSFGMLRAEWEPRLPTRPLNKAELRDYRAGHSAFLGKVAEIAGLGIGIAELTGSPAWQLH
jgi:hypothetical protein